MPFNLSNHQTIKILKLSRFFLLFFIFLGVLAVGPLVVEYYFRARGYLIPHFWNLYAVFLIITALIYLLSFWRMSISNKASGQVLLGGITIKLLICMIMAFIYLYNIDVNPTYFLLNFFYLYFFHTVFEIYCLLCNLRNQK